MLLLNIAYRIYIIYRNHMYLSCMLCFEFSVSNQTLQSPAVEQASGLMIIHRLIIMVINMLLRLAYRLIQCILGALRSLIFWLRFKVAPRLI